MARRSSSSWIKAAIGCALAAGLSASLCAATPVGAADVTPSPFPAEATSGDRPIGSARDAQQPSPALAPFTAPNDAAAAPDGVSGAVARAGADQLARTISAAALPASSRVDPVRVLRKVPGGFSALSYRVCSRSTDRDASCTESLPSGVPALVNVTGDGSTASPDATPDLLVDALPAANADTLVAAAGLTDPQRRSDALASALDAGLTVLSLRLTSSEVPATKPLRAEVRIDYDLPFGKRFSVTYDGLDRAAGLPRATSGTFALDAATGGIGAGLRTVGPAGSLGVDAAVRDGESVTAALRSRIEPVPAAIRVSAAAGPVTRVDIENSAPADRVDVALTGRGDAAVQATFSKVPTRAGYLVDVPGRRSEATASGALGRLQFRTRVPLDERVWSSATDATNVPGRFTTDFDAGTFALRSARGAIGEAAFAVNNHDGATVPRSPNHLAVRHVAATGDLDASVAAPGARTVGYARTAAGDQSYVLDTGPAVVALDTDILAGGDVEYFVGGVLTAPAAVGIATSGRQLRYTSDQPLGVRLTVAEGKVGALNDLFVPLYDQAVAVRTAECSGGGCETDTSEFCSESGRCFGVGANIAIDSKAPTSIITDLTTGTTSLGDHPADDLDVYFERDGLASHGS